MSVAHSTSPHGRQSNIGTAGTIVAGAIGAEAVVAGRVVSGGSVVAGASGSTATSGSLEQAVIKATSSSEDRAPAAAGATGKAKHCANQ